MSVRIRTYARSLMELMSQEDLVDICYEDLKDINDALNSDPELLQFITSADHSSAEKKERLQEVFNHELYESVLRGLFLIVESIPNKHMEADLIHEFISYYYRTRGIAFGAVYSARKIDKDYMKALEMTFSQKLSRRVRLENKIDPDLIGGVKVIVNDTVWDGSYKTKIDELRTALLPKD